MTIENKINQDLQADFEKFRDAPYTGGSVPEDIIEMFKEAIRALAPQFHKIHALKIKAIVQKQTKELTVDDLHEMAKAIGNTPLERLYRASFADMIEKHIVFEKFVLQYNTHVEEFQQKLMQKREVLKNISGGIQMQGSKGMRIIPRD